jgi:hypothetical protein
MKPNNLKRHLEAMHTECVGKTPEFFHRNLNESNNQKQTFKKLTIVT